MKYLIVLFFACTAVFADVKDDMAECNNWNEMKSLYEEIKNDDYQLRYFLRNIESSTKDYGSKILPDWLKNEVVVSVKSLDEYVAVEALKVAVVYTLDGISGLDSLFVNSNFICNSPIRLQSVILDYCANIDTPETRSFLSKIYLSRSQKFIMNPSFKKMYKLSLSRGVNTIEKDREFLNYAQSCVNVRNSRVTHAYQEIIDLLTSAE